MNDAKVQRVFLAVFPKTEVFILQHCDQTVTSKISIDNNIQILWKMGLLKVLKKIWSGQDCQDLMKVENALKLHDKVKAFDALTPEDKLKVCDELLVFYEQLRKVNLDYLSLEYEENEVRFQKESIIQSIHINDIHINDINLESM